MERPLLQTKVVTEHGLRTLATLGEWEDWIFSEEIKKYSELGYKFTILRGYTFGKKIIFKKYIDQLYEIKENLSKNNDKANPMYMISKLLMNSLYGRFGMSEHLPTHEIITQEDFNETIKKTNLIDAIELGHGRILISYNAFDSNKELNDYINDYDRSPNINISIAASISAYARIYMADILGNLDIKVYYSDTDCFFIEEKDLNNFNISSKLGDWSIDGVWKEVVFLAPKTYGGLLESGKEKFKIKGYNKLLIERFSNHLILKIL